MENESVAAQAVAEAPVSFENEYNPELGLIQVKNTDGSSLADIKLTSEEVALIDERAAAIDLEDSNVIVEYGASSQKNIADFSDHALENVKTKDLGEVGTMISTLVTELKGFDINAEEKKGFFGFFKKAPATIDRMKNNYVKAETNVDNICSQLQIHQNQLSKDIVLLDKMYEANLDYYKELTIYILAGKKRLEQERAGKLVELQAEAQRTGAVEDAQRANDYAGLLDRFEKKIFDLELTRAISIQMAPQIRLIQSSDIVMVEKIQTTLVNTIPLWKNQMVLALGVEDMRQATEATRAVSDMTNELLKKNAETLKQGTIAVAEESERSIIDIETVKQTNAKLIETLEEVLRISAEGRQKRADAEGALGQIEDDLRAKLLEIKH
ncbi:MAG: toxic anion resistance protein [Eggerthellales bacterium]|nr:toxic anion resistance protein [Eggerthellales bacterium]